MTEETPTTTVTTALENQQDTTALNVSLSQEALRNFRGEYDRLAEILGIFGTEVMPAGTTLYQLDITGSLTDKKDTDTGMSSGTSYVEGEEVALSKYTATKTPLEVVKVEPYRKVTTADAILRAGYEVAVLRTDRKMLSNVRAKVVNKFFSALSNGTGSATASTLQAALANADAALGNSLETNGDETSDIVHFVNRSDAAEYLGGASISTQTMFGLTYLADFLGVQRVFLTNKVTSGSLYVTPVENLHFYGLDFAELSRAGLSYASDETGIIGVSHTPAYDRVSAETHIVNGLNIVPEIKDYIVKGTIAPKA